MGYLVLEIQGDDDGGAKFSFKVLKVVFPMVNFTQAPPQTVNENHGATAPVDIVMQICNKAMNATLDSERAYQNEWETALKHVVLWWNIVSSSDGIIPSTVVNDTFQPHDVRILASVPLFADTLVIMSATKTGFLNANGRLTKFTGLTDGQLTTSMPGSRGETKVNKARFFPHSPMSNRSANGNALISIEVMHRAPISFSAKHSASIKYGGTARFFVEEGNGTIDYSKQLCAMNTPKAAAAAWRAVAQEYYQMSSTMIKKGEPHGTKQRLTPLLDPSGETRGKGLLLSAVDHVAKGAEAVTKIANARKLMTLEELNPTPTVRMRFTDFDAAHRQLNHPRYGSGTLGGNEQVLNNEDISQDPLTPEEATMRRPPIRDEERRLLEMACMNRTHLM